MMGTASFRRSRLRRGRSCVVMIFCVEKESNFAGCLLNVS